MAESYYRNVEVSSNKNVKTTKVTDTSLIDGDAFYHVSKKREWSDIGIMRIVLIILLFFTLGNVFFSSSGQSSVFTFSSLLTVLQNAPSLPFNLTVDALTISGDWGAFNFLKQFLNWNLKPLSFVIFLVGNLINILTFLSYFLYYIF